MNYLYYTACVVTGATALCKAFESCIINDGGGETDECGNTGLLFRRLLVWAAVLICAWRAWP